MKFIDRLMPAPLHGGFSMDDYWVWGGSALRGEDDRYHIFASRWPKRFPFFEGYIVASEVVRGVSDAPTGPYIFQEVVLPVRGADYWDGRMTHNPVIQRRGNTYLLFYIGSTFAGELPCPQDVRRHGCRERLYSYSNIRIGLATSRSVLGPWVRRECPVLEPRSGKWDRTIVTNPAPCVREDGTICLYYRSSTPDGLRIGLAAAGDPDSPFVRIFDDPVLRLCGENQVEDPCVWREGDRYQMLAKDMTGGLTGEMHAGVHLYSRDGLNWPSSDPAKAYSRNVVWEDGTRTSQGCLERPQVLVEKGTATHVFLATGDGPGGFRKAKRTWNMVIPLAPETGRP
jgi:hypothetical protein